MDMQVLVSTEHDSVLQRDVQVVNIKCTFTNPNAETIVYDTNFVENLTFMTQTVIASVYDATVMVMESTDAERSQQEEQQDHTKEEIKQCLGPMRRMNSSESYTCLICHEDIRSNQFYRTLPTCEHKYHKKCIDRWIFKNPTCPTCRRNIFSTENTNSSE